MLSWYKDFYAAHSQIKTYPYEGVLEALDLVKQEFPVAIVSNKPDGAVKALCAGYFPGVFALGEQEGCPRKPAPDMLVRTMEQLGCDNCIYIGDSEVDVETARNAGVDFAGVTTGTATKEDFEKYPNVCIGSSLTEIFTSI